MSRAGTTAQIGPPAQGARSRLGNKGLEYSLLHHVVRPAARRDEVVQKPVAVWHLHSRALYMLCWADRTDLEKPPVEAFTVRAIEWPELRIQDFQSSEALEESSASFASEEKRCRCSDQPAPCKSHIMELLITYCEHLPVSRVVVYSISLLGCFACMYKA